MFDFDQIRVRRRTSHVEVEAGRAGQVEQVSSRTDSSCAWRGEIDERTEISDLEGSVLFVVCCEKEACALL